MNWGIGRELYSAPFIWIKKDDCNIYTVQVNNKTIYRCNDNFEVSEIEIKDKTIVRLAITNTFTKKVVYTYGKKAPTVPFPEAEKKTAPTVTPPNPATLKSPEKTPAEPPKAPTPANSPNLDAERQAAINFVIMRGKKAGFTLGQLYKTDRAAYNEYAQFPESVEMAKAIKIINEWVGNR